MKFKHCRSTNADEAVKYFQVSLQGHTGQRPASYILLKLFKGLFVRAAMTPHRKQSVCQKKKKKSFAAKTLSFISLGQWAQKKAKFVLREEQTPNPTNGTQDFFCVGEEEGRGYYPNSNTAKT